MALERIRITDDGRTFQRGNSPFFYFADTVWSTFTNARLDEWKEYLSVRECQGFNALQINILPQWDRSIVGSHVEPFFPGKSDGWDFFQAE